MRQRDERGDGIREVGAGGHEPVHCAHRDERLAIAEVHQKWRTPPRAGHVTRQHADHFVSHLKFRVDGERRRDGGMLRPGGRESRRHQPADLPVRVDGGPLQRHWIVIARGDERHHRGPADARGGISWRGHGGARAVEDEVAQPRTCRVLHGSSGVLADQRLEPFDGAKHLLVRAGRIRDKERLRKITLRVVAIARDAGRFEEQAAHGGIALQHGKHRGHAHGLLWPLKAGGDFRPRADRHLRIEPRSRELEADAIRGFAPDVTVGIRQ